MTPHEREEHRREQLRRAKAKYKEKLKSTAVEDLARKVRFQQCERLRLVRRMTPKATKEQIQA
jgi:hypothetical protein